MSTSSRRDGEAVRVELGEVEDVADEPLESLSPPPRRSRATAARAPGRRRPLRAAPRRGRGSRSAACAARARPTSGSCAPSASTSASRSAISPNALAQVTELAGRVRRHRDVVVARRRPRRGVRELQDRSHDAAREIPREQRRDERARAARRPRAARSASVTRWLTSVFGVATTIAPTDCLPSVDRVRDGEVACAAVPGGVNSNVSDFPDCQSIVWIGSALQAR